MNNNFLLNIVGLLLLFAVIVIGSILVTSIDQVRYRSEQLIDKINDLEGKVSDISDNLKSGLVSTSAPNNNSSSNSVKSNLPVQFRKFANVEFFDKNAVSGGRYTTPITSDTKNMNALINNDSLVSYIWSYAYDSLAERNYQNPAVFEPKLAERWEASEDNMEYTITLKKGILWHDFTDPVSGKVWKDVEVTSRDFKFYVDVIKNKDTDCAPLRVYLKDLDRIEIIDDYNFKIIWKKKYFLSKVWSLGLSPLPRHLYHAYKGKFDGKRFNDDHERNRMLVGCGPYRFYKWEKGQRVILRKWDKYYGKKYGGMPSINEIVFEFIKHKTTQFQALKGGSIDQMSLTPDQWLNLTNTSEFDPVTGFILKKKYPARVYRYIGYNLKNPLFKDKLVRQALTHCINRQKIISEVYFGLARLTTGPFFMDTPYYDKSIKPYEYSIEKAKEKFKKAGWEDTDNDGILDKDGKQFRFTILAESSNPIYAKMLPIIKEDMGKAGVVVDIRKVEWSVKIEHMEKKNFEAIVGGWQMGLESDPYQLWHSSQADVEYSSNHVGFKNKRADKIIEEIRDTFDVEKRIKLCHEFHKILHEEQPYTFLFSRYNLIGINKRLNNIRVFSTGIPDQIMWLPKEKQKRIR